MGAPILFGRPQEYPKDLFMLNSMTGFARAVTETPFGTLTCELRTVNHRYLDVQFRLPEELRPKEIELRNRIGDSLKRGKVECSLHLRRQLSGDAELRLNEELVNQVGERIRQIARLLPETRSIDPVDVLRWPGVVTEPEIDAEPLFAEASALIDKALQSLALMRESEGARIADMLTTRLDDIASIAAGVRERMPGVLAAIRDRQKERIDKLGNRTCPDCPETGRRRGAGQAGKSRQRSDRGIAKERTGRPPPGLPHAGTQSRSQYAWFEIRGYRYDERSG
jgi:uncharacterized protein (TIGR00255 family)